METERKVTYYMGSHVVLYSFRATFMVITQNTNYRIWSLLFDNCQLLQLLFSLFIVLT